MHRDIKPANIQVCQMGDYCDWVKVLDFGLVKTLGGDVPEAGLTAPHTVTGTPACLSPESALGEAVDQLDRLVLACLAKKPGDRPATARDLCDRLGECAAELVWTREDARRWWETRMAPEPALTL